VRLYHSTTEEAAAAIESGGFRDGRSASFNRDGELCRGVWLADRDVSDPFSLGTVMFVVEVPDDEATSFEWLDEEGQSANWRAFLIPAKVLNQHERARTVPTPVPPQP
jgi:hypothetical protein